MNHQLHTKQKIIEQEKNTIATPTKVDVSCVEHQSWGNSCDVWTLLQTDNLSVLEESMPADTSDEMHYHSKSHQFLYVLEGEVSINLNNNITLLTKHQGIQIPAGTPHCVFNNGSDKTRFLLISSPYHRDDRVLING